MFRFVFRKMLNKKWLMAALLIGNILLVAIAAGSPMYTDAALQKMLTQTMTDYVVEKGRYPTTAYLLGTVPPGAKETSSAMTDFRKEDELAATMADQLGVPQKWLVRNVFLDAAVIQPEEVRSNFQSKQVRIGTLAGLEDHAKILSGRLYEETNDDVIEVVVSQKGLISMNLMLDECFTIDKMTWEDGSPVRIRVVGIYEASSEDDHYWYKTPSDYNNELFMSRADFERMTGDMTGLRYKLMGLWFVMMDYESMSIDDVDNLLVQTEAYRVYHKSSTNVSYSDYYSSILTQYKDAENRIIVTLRILQIPIYALLAAFIFMVAGQIIGMEQSEISVLKSRGASKRQILGIYLLQSFLTALVSLLIGLPLASVVCQILGSANAFLEFVSRKALAVRYTKTVLIYAGTAAVVSMAAMVLPALRYARLTIVAQKQKKRKKSGSWLLRLLPGLVLLGVSLYGLYSFNGQKDILAQKVLAGEGLDPLLFLSSSLFIVSLGLIAIQLVHGFAWLVYRIGRKHWSPAMYSAFLTVLRTRNSQGTVIAFLVITLAIGIFNARTARTVNTNEEQRILYMAGPDIRVQEAWEDNREESAGPNANPAFKLTYTEPDYGKYLALHDAEVVTRVIYDRDASCSTNLPSTAYVDCLLMGINTKEFGQCVDFKTDLLPTHWYNYLNAMAADPTAVLVSRNMKDMLGFNLGDSISYRTRDGFGSHGVIVGFVDYWPTFNPITTVVHDDGTTTEINNYLVVGHFAYMMNAWGAVPYQVWMKAKDTTDFIYDFAADSGVRFTEFSDASAEMVALKNDPIFQGTNGILTLSFVVALAVCAVGFLIFWILSIRSRTLLLGIFRAMGMTMREVIGMLLGEQFFISFVSIAIGIGGGILTAKLYVPLVQIAYANADTVIPMEIISRADDMTKLLCVVAAMVILCMAVLGVLISKIRISRALKLGED